MQISREEDVEKIELNLFLEALFQRYGYDFRNYSRASIRRRIRHMMIHTGHDHLSELISNVLYDETFAHQVILEFSVAVTEMFRDPTFYVAVREKVIPYLKTFPFIKIWHAGCASGEEVYSLAILLKEEGLYDRATIFATDFNEVILEKAREGIYPLKDIRQYSTNYAKAGGQASFSDYYHAQYDSAIIDRTLKRNITFASHNLVTDGVFGEMQLIFCRNVLIYFDRPLQNRVLQLFNESLENGGFLCLGSKESLDFSSVVDHFKGIDVQERVYQKRLR